MPYELCKNCKKMDKVQNMHKIARKQKQARRWARKLKLTRPKSLFEHIQWHKRIDRKVEQYHALLARHK
jgi:hypothetical protein